MVKIKICGITREEDYRYVSELGADFIGFVFFQGSPRYISPEKAREIINKYNFPVKHIGVFVNETPASLQNIFHHTKLDIAQLYNDKFSQNTDTPAIPFWKALRIKDQSFLEELAQHPTYTYVIDGYSDSFYGGSGKQIPLGLIKSAITKHPRIIAAGGISTQNIADIIKLSPFAVDISSSIEDSPGIKNHRKLAALFDIFRKCNAEESKNET